MKYLNHLPAFLVGAIVAVSCISDAESDFDDSDLESRVSALESDVIRLSEPPELDVTVVRALSGPGARAANAFCPVETTLLGGGCDCDDSRVGDSDPLVISRPAGCVGDRCNQWECFCESNSVNAHAVCGKIVSEQDSF